MLLWHFERSLGSKVITEMDIKSPILLLLNRFLELSPSSNAAHWRIKSPVKVSRANQLLQITVRFSSLI
jgi:hypothetical protein